MVRPTLDRVTRTTVIGIACIALLVPGGCAATGDAAVAAPAPTAPSVIAASATSPVGTAEATAAPPAATMAMPNSLPTQVELTGSISVKRFSVIITSPSPPSIDPCHLLEEGDVADLAANLVPSSATVGTPMVSYGSFGSGTRCLLTDRDSADKRAVEIGIYDHIDPVAVAAGLGGPMVDSLPGIGDASYYNWAFGLNLVVDDTLAQIEIDSENGFHTDDDKAYQAVGAAVASELG